MAFDPSHMFETLLIQCPIAGAGIWIAKVYMQKHEAAVEKLIGTFEAEVKACEARYEMVFKELMLIKSKIK